MWLGSTRWAAGCANFSRPSEGGDFLDGEASEFFGPFDARSSRCFNAELELAFIGRGKDRRADQRVKGEDRDSGTEEVNGDDDPTRPDEPSQDRFVKVLHPDEESARFAVRIVAE